MLAAERWCLPVIGLWWMETIKLVFRKRWLAVFPAFALVAFLNIDYLLGYQLNYQIQNYHLHLNIWDGVIGTFFNYLYFRFVILLLFVFLVTDSVIGDIASNWVWLTLNRCSNRYQWWTAKVASVFTAGLIYTLLGMVIVFFVSLLSLPYETSFSRFATNPPSFFITLGTYVIPPGTNPFVFCAKLVLYTAFAISIFALIPVTLSLILRKAYLVPMIPFGWLILSHFLNSNRTYFQIDIVPRLVYGAYFYSQVARPLSFSISLLYLSIVGIALWFLGAYILSRTDF